MWSSGLRTRRIRAGALVFALLSTGLGHAPDPPRLPFGVGEELVFRATSSRFGTVGTGTMRVERPEAHARPGALLLRFDLEGKLGPLTVADRTRSWFLPDRLASFRYHKEERHPLGSRTIEVAMDPARRWWASAAGEGGRMPTDAPLDELSFLYFLRTLPLGPGVEHSLTRHYEARRNPVSIRVVGRTRLSVPAGTFDVVEVEMRVRDGRYGSDGAGVIQLHLTDDRRRIPVRIESAVPLGGTMVLSLQSYSPGSPAAPGRSATRVN